LQRDKTIFIQLQKTFKGAIYPAEREHLIPLNGHQEPVSFWFRKNHRKLWIKSVYASSANAGNFA
jgi:hypothetical protein